MVHTGSVLSGLANTRTSAPTTFLQWPPDTFLAGAVSVLSGWGAAVDVDIVVSGATERAGVAGGCWDGFRFDPGGAVGTLGGATLAGGVRGMVAGRPGVAGGGVGLAGSRVLAR